MHHSIEEAALSHTIPERGANEKQPASRFGQTAAERTSGPWFAPNRKSDAPTRLERLVHPKVYMGMSRFRAVND